MNTSLTRPLPRILARSSAALLLTTSLFAFAETWDGGGADTKVSASNYLKL